MSAIAFAWAAPLNALSRWLCCLASCSKVSSSRTRCSRSACRAFCHRLLCAWASARKSRQAWGAKTASTKIAHWQPFFHSQCKLMKQLNCWYNCVYTVCDNKDSVPATAQQSGNSIQYTAKVNKLKDTYIDHSIRGDAEQRGPLCNLTDFLPSLSS